MQPDDFTEPQRRHLIRLPDGIWAYSPPPTPRRVGLSMRLAHALSEADQALGELSGTGKHLPNPHVLISPYLRREAVLSSRIEGTETGLVDLLLLETGSSASAPTDDDREVANYVGALEWGIAELERLPISLRMTRELHRRLLAGTRGEERTPGEFRRFQNYVAPRGTPIERATYVPPPAQTAMLAALDDWERFVHERDELPLLLRCALMHYQFETIHPFADGNGRVGRLLIPLLLLERRALAQPLLYVSGHLERRRDEYYDSLMIGRLTGDLDPWVHLFLDAVTAQAREAMLGAERLSQLRADYHERFGKTKSSIIRPLIDDLFLRVVVAAPSIARQFDVSYVTAQAAIQDLVDAGVLREMTGKRRNRAYFAHEIMSVIMPEEPQPSGAASIARQ